MNIYNIITVICSAIATFIGVIANTLQIIQYFKSRSAPKNSYDGNTIEAHCELRQTKRTSCFGGLFALIILVLGILGLVFSLNGGFDDSEKKSDNELPVSSSVVSEISSEDYTNDKESSKTVSEDTGSKSQDTSTTNGKVWAEDVTVLEFDNGGSSYNKYSFEDGVLSNTGETLHHALRFKIIDDWYWRKIIVSHFDFYLNKEYENFTSRLVLLDKEKNTKGEIHLEIICDDNVISEYDITSGFLPTDINVNVSDVTILRFQITNKCKEKGFSPDVEIAFGDAFFTK